MGVIVNVVMSEEESTVRSSTSKMPYFMLRIEGLIILIAAVIFAFYLHMHWLLVIGVFLFIDVSMAGYLFNPKIGAIIWNIGHTLSIPIILLIIAVIGDFELLLNIIIIWIGHIGYDKMLGFGMKYPTNLNDGIFQRI